MNPVSSTWPIGCVNRWYTGLSVSLLLMVASVLCLATASPALAWYAQTHHEMSEATFNSLPPEIRKNINYQAFLIGSNEPDNTMYDPSSPNGYKNMDWNDAERKTGIPKPILQSWTSPKTHHGDPNYINRLNEQLKRELASPVRDWNRISFMMGQMSHHFQDLHQPFHAAEYLNYPNHKLKDHDRYEEWAKQSLAGRLHSGSLNATSRDLNAIARESASMLDSPNLYDQTKLQQIATSAVNDLSSRFNNLVSEALSQDRIRNEQEKVKNQLRDLIEQAPEKLKELERNIRHQTDRAIEDSKKNFPGAWPNQHTRTPAPPQPPVDSDSTNCPFRWTHPRCKMTFCCPYDNGWSKECLNAGKCHPAVYGCMKSFGCRRVE